MDILGPPAIRPNAIWPNAIRTNTIRTKAIRTKAIRTNAVRTNVIRTNVGLFDVPKEQPHSPGVTIMIFKIFSQKNWKEIAASTQIIAKYIGGQGKRSYVTLIFKKSANFWEKS
jgi:hypothetical protein